MTNEDQLVRELRPIAKRTAQRISRTRSARHLGHLRIGADELEAAALAGLLQAVRSHDPERGPLEVWAAQRARFAVIDYLRDEAPPVSLRRQDQPHFVRIGDSGAGTREQLAGQGGSRADAWIADGTEVPAAALPAQAERDLAAWLTWCELLRCVPSMRLRALVDLRYREGLNLREIGQVLGLSESRACQLLQQAHGLLREALRRDRRLVVAGGAR